MAYLVSHVAYSALGLAVLLLVLDYARILLQRANLPPGPFPIPLFGNTLRFPAKKPWILIEALSKQYESAAITFWVGRQPTIWLNDGWAAHELLHRRAAKYASRPRQVVLGELLGGLSNMAVMYYGPRWRLHRRLTHGVVGRQKLRGYRAVQDWESRVTAGRILARPDEYVAHLERAATSVMCIIGTGRRVVHNDDPLTVKVIKVTAEAGETVVPGKHFPMILETFPIAASLLRLLMAFSAGSGEPDMYYGMAEEAATRQEDCYFKDIFLSIADHRLSRDEVTSLTGNIFGAGVETSTYTLLSFVLAACCFPESLATARDELDGVCGPHRSPSGEDAERLPHVQAVAKEVLRWRAPAVLGGQPHAPLEDDYYEGYLIPKGTSITGNLWAIHRHERDFPQPDRFCPERHFPGHELHRSFPNEDRHMAFGWGRRVCAGKALAEQGLMTQIARLLWAFDIEAARDEATGAPARLDIFDYTNGFNIRPRPFPCRFTPRSDEIRQTIVRETREAERQLMQYEMQR